MIMLLNWLLTIITFGTFSLASITMTNVDEYSYETVTDSGITLIDLFGETSAFDGTGYNLIENGDFSDGTTAWSYYVNGGNPNLTVSSGVGYFYPNVYGAIGQPDLLVDDHIFYMSADMMLDSLVQYNVNWLAYETTGIGANETFATNVSITELTTYSEVNTISSSYSHNDFGLGRTPNGVYIYIDNVMLYDLTDIFGSGNEPTVSEMDTWYATYQTALTTNQHEYTYTLNTIDLEDIVVLVSSAFMWYVAIKLFREVI